jgi:hypothetical protein
MQYLLAAAVEVVATVAQAVAVADILQVGQLLQILAS